MLEIPELNTLLGTDEGGTYVVTQEYRDTLKEAVRVSGQSVRTIAKEIGIGSATLYKIMAGTRSTINTCTYTKLAQLDKKGDHLHE